MLLTKFVPKRCLIESLCRYKSCLVVVEHDNKKYNTSTLNAITAAKKLGQVICLIGGEKCSLVAESLKKVPGIDGIITAENASLQGFKAESMTQLVLDMANKNKYTHILAVSGTFSKNFLPRVAAKLNVSPISDVIEIISSNTFCRCIYAGNVIEKVESKSKVNVISIRSTNFEPCEINKEVSIKVEKFEIQDEKNAKSKYISQSIEKSDRPELTDAKIVIAGGRGLKSSDNFDMIYNLADKMSAAVGASRAAVDAGYVPNELQVGQTGKIVAPELYIAVGISGAIQHLAGMKDSKYIVAINTDPDAPIFQVTDYGLVQDLFSAIPEISKTI